MTGVPPGLAASQAPPPLLPGEHFAAALAFLLAGAVGAVAVAPDLARAGYPVPAVVAVTHLFTLGWITTSIMGALYQFLPVALGAPIRSVGLAHAGFFLHVPGVALFVAGLALGPAWLLLAGAALVGAGLLLFAANLGATLARAPRRDLTWWALAGADLFLVVTVTLGLALAGNRRWGYLGVARFTALGVHLHVALAGWVLLAVVGVARRLLPMFLLSHAAGERLATAAVALLAGGAATLTVGHHGPPLVSRWIPGLLLGSGLAAFLAQAVRYFRHRHRPALDPGLRLVAAGLVTLAAALALALVAARLGAPRPTVAYVLVAILGLTLFVAGHYYKIVPFLVWYHRFGPLAGKRPLPRVTELYSHGAATAAGAALAAGTLLLPLAVGLDSPAVARAGAALLAIGAVVEATQMLKLSRTAP